jgi:hypothetical protein
MKLTKSYIYNSKNTFELVYLKLKSKMIKGINI